MKRRVSTIWREGDELLGLSFVLCQYSLQHSLSSPNAALTNYICILLCIMLRRLLFSNITAGHSGYSRWEKKELDEGWQAPSRTIRFMAEGLPDLRMGHVCMHCHRSQKSCDWDMCVRIVIGRKKLVSISLQ